MSSWLTHTVNVFCPFTIFCSVFIYFSHDFLSNVKIKAPKFTVCMLEPLHVYFLAWPQMTDRLILLQLFMNFHSQIWLWWYFQVLVVCRWISFSLWLKAKQHIQSCSVASPQEQFSYLILKYLKSFFVCFLNIKKHIFHTSDKFAFNVADLFYVGAWAQCKTFIISVLFHVKMCISA